MSSPSQNILNLASSISTTVVTLHKVYGHWMITNLSVLFGVQLNLQMEMILYHPHQ